MQSPSFKRPQLVWKSEDLIKLMACCDMKYRERVRTHQSPVTRYPTSNTLLPSIALPTQSQTQKQGLGNTSGEGRSRASSQSYSSRDCSRKRSTSTCFCPIVYPIIYLSEVELTSRFLSSRPYKQCTNRWWIASIAQGSTRY
jgi:hypothetical protein